jgi:8-oxo-dGTP pyrophosphatase MutT (NUDIX family)
VDARRDLPASDPPRRVGGTESPGSEPDCHSGRIDSSEPLHYGDELRADLAHRLDRHPRRSHPLDGRKHAAVAIVIVDSDADRHDGDPLFADGPDLDWGLGDVPGDTDGLDGRMEGVAGGAAFLLCRRPSRMNRHAGQWALPGGRLDPGEGPLEAALREVDEEIGLRLDAGSVIGWLDDYPTRSGYVITPIVLWGGADPHLQPSPAEVLALYRVGLHALRDGTPRHVRIPESDRPVIQIPLGGDLIHAPTGAVLYQFRQVGLLGETGTRVDHLEQPVFAWR